MKGVLRHAFFVAVDNSIHFLAKTTSRVAKMLAPRQLQLHNSASVPDVAVNQAVVTSKQCAGARDFLAKP